jgi:transposase InsO family protein
MKLYYITYVCCQRFFLTHKARVTCPPEIDPACIFGFCFGSSEEQVNGQAEVVRKLGIVDEFTRECLAIEVARSLRSQHVLECLGDLFLKRGTPDYIRSDNGPEFTAHAVREWLDGVDVETLFIEPGSPWENGYVESFNGKFRDELLNGEIFYTLKEAQVIIERWRREYNSFRPHSALGYRPPAPETVQWPWPRDEEMLLGLT